MFDREFSFRDTGKSYIKFDFPSFKGKFRFIPSVDVYDSVTKQFVDIKTTSIDYINELPPDPISEYIRLYERLQAELINASRVPDLYITDVPLSLGKTGRTKHFSNFRRPLSFIK